VEVNETEFVPSVFNQQQIAFSQQLGEVGLNISLRNTMGMIQTDVANAGATWEDSEVVDDQGIIYAGYTNKMALRRFVKN